MHFDHQAKSVQYYKGDKRISLYYCSDVQQWFTVKLQLHTFLTLAFDMDEKSNLTLGKEPFVPLNMTESSNSFWLSSR
jgi:hypothetical protein